MSQVSNPAGQSQSLRGRVALVTGAARRLGAAVARALAARGAEVIVHYHRSEADAEALSADIRSRGGRARPMQADLAAPTQVLALSAQAGPVDLLVNNASIFPRDRFWDAPAAGVDASLGPPHQRPHSDGDANGSDALAAYLAHLGEVFGINTLAPALLIRALAASGRPAHVINLLDTRVARGDPEHLAYTLSKQLLAQLTRDLALELAPTIRVNAVAPGPILPPVGADFAALAARARSVPLGRPGSPEDVVRAILFFAESDYITGQVLYVDGGAHLASRPSPTPLHGPEGAAAHREDSSP